MQSNGGTLTIGGSLIQNNTKCLLLWPVEEGVLKSCLNYSPLFRDWTLRAGSPVDQQEIEHNKISENRRHRRFELETDVRIRSANGFLPGRTLDISASGMAAILPVELQVGEIVELNIKLPIALAASRAVVRNRNVFRHGFEFLQPLHDVVRHETADDDCQSCGSAGFNVQAVDGKQGVAFMRTRCPDCGGTGKQA